MEGMEYNQSRRSSILKQEKQRNPLAEIDFRNEDVLDDPANIKSSRRVSFASSCNVKQFVADPEKNTIWDTTYEECLSKSDSSASSHKFKTNRHLSTTKYGEDSSSDLEFTEVVDTEVIYRSENEKHVRMQANDTIIFNKTSLEDDLQLTCMNFHNCSFNSDNTNCLMEFTLPVLCLNEEDDLEHVDLDEDMNLNKENQGTINFNKSHVNLAQTSEFDNVPLDMDLTQEIVTLPLNQQRSNIEMCCMEQEQNALILNSNSVPISNENFFQNPITKEVPLICLSSEMELLKTDNEKTKDNISFNLSWSESNIAKSNEKQINVKKIQNMGYDLSALGLQINSEPLSKKAAPHISDTTQYERNVMNKGLNEDCNETRKNYDVTSLQTLSFKTPQSSFHTDIMNDDTQHLINYPFGNKTLSKSDFSKIVDGDYNPSPMNSKFMILTDSINVSLNTDENVSGICDHLSKNSTCNKSLLADKENYLGNGINETRNSVFLSNETELVETFENLTCNSKSGANEKKEKSGQVETLDGSLSSAFNGMCITGLITSINNDIQNLSETINICQEVIDLSNNTMYDEHTSNVNIYTGEKAECANLKEKLEQKISEIKDVESVENLYYWDKILIPDSFKMIQLSRNSNKITQNINKNINYAQILNKVVDRKLDEFLPIFIKPIDELIHNDNYSDIIEDIEDLDQKLKLRLEDLKTESMKTKVEKLHDGCDGYWDILCLENSVYKFSTLFETISITVYLDEASGMISGIDVDGDHITDSSEAIALYMHKIFIERLHMKCIQSALGAEFHVLSLLDYIQMTMQKMIDIERDFYDLGITFGVTMDNSYSIKFKVVNLNLLTVLEFSVNALELNNITDKTLTYKLIVGNNKDSDIRNCIANSPNGFSFVRSFIVNVYECLQYLQKHKIKKAH